MVHHILKNKIDLIFPQVSTKQKCSIIASLVSGFIGLAYEGISSFLQNKRHKALKNAVKALDSKTITQCNKLMHLENSMVMYGIHNAETIEKLINAVHYLRNITTPYEKLFAGKQNMGLLHLYTLICKAYNTTP